MTRTSQEYDDVVEELRNKLEFVRLIVDLQDEVKAEDDYVGIATRLHADGLLEDAELQFVLDLVCERDLGLSKVSDSAREEFLDAAWEFAVRLGSMVWDRYVRRRLAEHGWVIADFRQRKGHRPDFLAHRNSRWIVMAARVGGVSVWHYGGTAERLAKHSFSVPIAGRCIVIPGSPGDRKGTVLEEEEKEAELNDRAKGRRRGVKVLELQGSLLVNPGRALQDNPCNQDALLPRGRCA